MNLEVDNIAGFHRNWTEAGFLDIPRWFAGDIADQGRFLSGSVGDQKGKNSCRDHKNNVIKTRRNEI